MSGGVAIVTGAAGGIGTVIAQRLSERGHKLLLVDRDPRVDATAGELAGRSQIEARSCVADITEPAGRAKVREAALDVDKPLMVLVNNAGITRDARVENMSSEQFDEVVSVNLLAPMELTIEMADDLAEGASVVNMSSRSGLGNFGQVNYAASKSGLAGFTRAMALRLAPRVRVNAVAPGLIVTPMTDGMPEEVLATLVSKIPARRIGTPADVAGLVAFLVSDEASYVTGQTILICGGRSIAP